MTRAIRPLRAPSWRRPSALRGALAATAARRPGPEDTRQGLSDALQRPPAPDQGTRQRCAVCGRWCRRWWRAAGVVYGPQCARYLWAGLPRPAERGRVGA